MSVGKRLPGPAGHWLHSDLIVRGECLDVALASDRPAGQPPRPLSLANA